MKIAMYTLYFTVWQIALWFLIDMFKDIKGEPLLKHWEVELSNKKKEAV